MIKQFSIGKNAKVKFDMDKLKRIEEEVGKHFVVRVGIMGSKTIREAQRSGETHEEYKKRIQSLKKVTTKSTVTNAEIGLAMEKGIISKRVPARSWLELPLILKSQEIMTVAKTIFDNMTSGNIERSYKLLGVKAEEAIQEGFDTAGFGQWAPLKSREGTPLIDTGQLRKSVSSVVVST